MSSLQDVMRKAITAIREDEEEYINSLPDIAITEGQKELVKKHGTPRTMARAIVNAIGEISVTEAHDAILRYNEKWNQAK